MRTPFPVPLPFLLLLPALLQTAAPAPAQEKGAKAVRVLLLSGANNHDWRRTTPAYKAALEQGGGCTVTVTETPATLQPADLDRFDLVVSNWNTFTRRNQPPRPDGWSPALRRAYIDFVRRGGGHLAVHAGSSSFYDWPEYQELVMGSFKVGTTSHGRLHPFPVRLDRADHPILRGLGSFHIVDELWHRVPWKPEGKVLASAWSSKASGGSGAWEPVLVTRRYGKGRSATLLLGHDARTAASPAFGTLLRRCARWAATGRVKAMPPRWWPDSPAAARAAITPPAKALAALKGYAPGRDRTPLQVVAELTRSVLHRPEARKSLADRLAAGLATVRNDHLARFLIHQLGLVAGEEHLPALAARLDNPATAMAARWALETLALPGAARILREALGKAEGPERIALVRSLGLKGDAQAVPTLIALAEGGRAAPAAGDGGEHRALRLAVLNALGRIGTPRAIAHLQKGLAPGARDRVPIARLLLDHADRQLLRWLPLAPGGEGESLRRRLLGTYQVLLVGALPSDLRRRAGTGVILCQEAAARLRFLGTFLKVPDREGQLAALQAVDRLASPEATAILVDALPHLDPRVQPAAVALLGRLRARTALPRLLPLATSPHAEVRKQVYRTMGLLGDGGAVPALLQAHLRADANERLQVRDALERLPGKGVREALVQALGAADDISAVLATRTLAGRRDRAALPALRRLTNSPRKALAKAAERAIRTLDGLAWKKTADSVALLCGGVPLWRFRWDRNRAKPHFEHLAPRGVEGNLLALRPADHPWHHGLWFSWKLINGVNFWEEDRRTGRSAGVTAWAEPEVECRPDMGATIKLRLRYHLPGAPPLLVERRVIVLAPPAADGSLRIDWHSTFTAGATPVLLDRTPPPGQPGGKLYGGYAGLSARLSTALQDRQVIGTGSEPVGFERGRHRSRRTAMDYSGTLAGRAVGLTLLDHPDNPVHPTPWYVIRSRVMSFITPAFLTDAPHRIPPKGHLELRWRLTVHRGRLDTDALTTRAAAYGRKEKP